MKNKRVIKQPKQYMDINYYIHPNKPHKYSYTLKCNHCGFKLLEKTYKCDRCGSYDVIDKD